MSDWVKGDWGGKIAGLEANGGEIGGKSYSQYIRGGEKSSSQYIMTASAPIQSAGISKLPFWDVDFNSLDTERDSLFILEKVFNYGLWSDYKAVYAFYGMERIRREIVRASYLKKDVLSFLCLILNLKPADFKCFTKTQLLPPLWDS